MYDKDKIRQAIWDNPTPATGLYFERHGQEQWSRQRLDGTDSARPDKSVLKYGRNGELLVIYNGSSYPTTQSIWEFLKWRYNTNEPIEMYKAAAEAYGIQGDTSELPEEQRRAIAKRAEDATIIAEVAKYLTEQLNTEDGKAARDYLHKRGLDPTERMGAYSRKIRAGLLKYLTAGFKTIPADTMDKKLNTLLTEDWNADDYGLVLPYYNGSKATGFCLRRITPIKIYTDKNGNQRETPKYLYSLSPNKGGSFEKNGYCGSLNANQPVILVEGALDAERCKQVGFNNVMALGGKTPTDGEVKTLLRHGAKTIIQVPDFEFNDSGELDEAEAVGGTIKKLTPLLTGRIEGAGFVSYKVARLHNEGGQDKTKQDADSFIRHYGADAFGEVLRTAQPWYKWAFEDAAAHNSGDELAARALAIYTAVKSPIDAENIKRSLQGQPTGVYAKLKEAGVSSAVLKQIDAGAGATTYRESIEAVTRELTEAVARHDTADNIAAILRRASRLQSNGGQTRLAAQMNATRDYYESLVKAKPEELQTGWALYNGKGRKLRNISFPIGYYSVIAAPTGYGKTAFLMQTAINLARSLRKVFIFVSCEEDEEQLYIRALATYLGEILPSTSGAWTEWEEGFINPKNELRRTIKQDGFTGTLDLPEEDLPEEEKTEEQRQRDRIKKREERTAAYWREVAPFLKFYHSANGEVNELCNNIAAVVEDLQAVGVEVGGVFLDYVQLMRTTEAKYSRSEELYSVCTQLNAFAKEMQLAIIMGGQTNREATKQTGNRPKDIDAIDLNNLGDSTGIERTAAEVYLLLRPERLIKETDLPESGNIDDTRSFRTKRCLQYADGGGLEIKPNRLYIENLKARNYAQDGYGLIEWDAPTGAIKDTSDKPQTI